MKQGTHLTLNEHDDDDDYYYYYYYYYLNPLSTGILYGHLLGVTIPEAVIIQFVLLRMSKLLLETY